MPVEEILPRTTTTAHLALSGGREIAYHWLEDSFRSNRLPEPDPMAAVTPPSKSAESSAAQDHGAIPPLENGDRLTRAEFERRYDAMPELKKAELVEGEVYMPSPVRHGRHSHPHTRLVTWLGNYETDTPGVEAGDNGSIRLDLDNELQPDAFLIIRPERGGQARISEDDYIEGAPELVAEVASSSASYDLGKKLNAYRRNGVREYVVWRVLDLQVDWFVNREGRFELLAAAADGILRSTVFPGLWLDPAALVRGEKAAVKAILEQGLSSPEHADFAARLERHRIA
jgi:Uma2 family endonuclease